MAIAARGQAVVVPAIDIAHVVTGTLPKLMITVAQVEIIIVVVDVHVLGPGLLTVIDTTDLAADPDMMMMTDLEIEVHVASASAAESEHQAQNANLRRPNLRRTSETEGLFLCNNLLQGYEPKN